VPAGWLVVARRWDDAQLLTLANLTESEVQWAPPGAPAAEPRSAADLVTLRRTLADWRGRPVRTRLVTHRVPEFEVLRDTVVLQTGTVLVFGLVLVVALAVALHAWVLRPLRGVRESLARGDPGPLAAWREERTEFGQIAQLVESSLEQRQALRNEVAERGRAEEALRRSEAELRRTLDERARLGRDLHDGVIQSLYATGMGLKAIRQQLQPGQEEAAARLEQTRAALNEVIHDVRNFIIGLEPEALKLQTFSQAVAALLEFVQGQRPLRSTLAIDEAVAASLTLAQRVHALQIAREAVSNALRHGEATHVQITLAKEGEFVAFEVRDNGRGFDPAARGGSGHGFSSFTQRARELGAELTLQSQPGHGAQVRLVFSPLSRP
jgi:signal transduction histidine kinase